MQKQKKPNRYSLNRAEVVDANFIEFVTKLGAEHAPPRPADGEPIAPGSGLTCGDVRELLESQIICRHQDLEARNMRARNEGFYTIGSAGHEGNAVVGRVTRHTDIAFLHYRSGALMAERARKVPSGDFIKDSMLSFAASTEDPIAGGRHKVWGSVPLWVPPQTSTIASHLPKAVGCAMSFARAKRFKMDLPIPLDSIVVCTFGDASCNHSVAQAGFNAAAHAAHQKLPIPILFVCEDNGLGISVSTPPGWVEETFRAKHGIKYFRGDGLDLVDAHRATAEAVDYCRSRRRPTFLHLRVVRLLGHAGSDPETEYRSWPEIETTEAHDPLRSSARLAISRGVLSVGEVLGLYEDVRRRVAAAAAYAEKTPKLTSAEEIVRPLAMHSEAKVCAEAARVIEAERRAEAFGGADHLPETRGPRHMAVNINSGLHDVLAKYPEGILFGEDVARKGGVYHVTAGLSRRFGVGRVFNTILDETTILGLSIGAAHLGFLPIPEIQYLAYYHNAQDQIRGEASSLPFFSNDQFRNPMVMRIAGWAYQKGFGGHFHNDNSIAALRDVPGIVIASPSRGDDAVKMMRTCMAMAKVDGRVIAFIEPIALYMTKDLHEPKDGGWSFDYPAPGEFIPLGEGCVYNEDATDLTIVTFANGLYRSLRAAKELREEHGIRARVVDLRWLWPLNEELIEREARATGRVLVVDESRRSGGMSEPIFATLLERCGGEVKASRVTGVDSFIPLGPAADYVLPQESDIVSAARSLLGSRSTS